MTFSPLNTSLLARLVTLTTALILVQALTGTNPDRLEEESGAVSQSDFGICFW